MNRLEKKLVKQVHGILAAQPYRTFKPKELAKQIRVSKPDYPAFRDMLKRLANEGKIAKYKSNHYGLMKRATVIEGVLHVKTQGYGFLITEEGEEDVFVSQKNMGVALNGDTVRVQLFAHTKGKSREGRVIEVVKRARRNIVGTFHRTRRFAFVEPDDLKITRDIFIHEGDTLNAKDGQK
ncbi:MAG: hypothetical protein D6743_13485, partial [Calditrichaeota bacterium]